MQQLSVSLMHKLCTITVQLAWLQARHVSILFNDSEFCFYKSQLLKEGTLKVSFKSNCLSSSLFLFPSYLHTLTLTNTQKHTHTHILTETHKQTNRHARMHAESEKKTCCFSQRHNLSKFNGRERFCLINLYFRKKNLLLNK